MWAMYDSANPGYVEDLLFFMLQLKVYLDSVLYCMLSQHCFMLWLGLGNKINWFGFKTFFFFALNTLFGHHNHGQRCPTSQVLRGTQSPLKLKPNQLDFLIEI